MRRRLVLIAVGCMAVMPALALYDTKPEESLAVVQGEWRGSLTYRDYSEPKRLVTLPTRLFIALSAPDELVLNYVFDDGPTKTVYSYERMKFNFARREVTWVAGRDAKPVVCRVTADNSDGESRSLVLEQGEAGEIKRYTLALGARKLTFGEDEVSSAGVVTFRNRYEFSRIGVSSGQVAMPRSASTPR